MVLQKNPINNTQYNIWCIGVVEYIRQTLCTPLFVRPRLHILSRYLQEGGISMVPIDIVEHRRNKQIAQQHQTVMEPPTLESAVLRMTYQMYTLLNAMALVVFAVEIVWSKL